MTNHLSISKQLALAIGYLPEHVDSSWGLMRVWNMEKGYWKRFDYRDEVIAFRVAQRYDCFPQRDYSSETKWAALAGPYPVYADTPQLAIAMAVIEAMKPCPT